MVSTIVARVAVCRACVSAPRPGAAQLPEQQGACNSGGGKALAFGRRQCSAPPRHCCITIYADVEGLAHGKINAMKSDLNMQRAHLEEPERLLLVQGLQLPAAVPGIRELQRLRQGAGSVRDGNACKQKRTRFQSKSHCLRTITHCGCTCIAAIDQLHIASAAAWPQTASVIRTPPTRPLKRCLNHSWLIDQVELVAYDTLGAHRVMALAGL